MRKRARRRVGGQQCGSPWQSHLGACRCSRACGAARADACGNSLRGCRAALQRPLPVRPQLTPPRCMAEPVALGRW